MVDSRWVGGGTSSCFGLGGFRCDLCEDQQETNNNQPKSQGRVSKSSFALLLLVYG